MGSILDQSSAFLIVFIRQPSNNFSSAEYFEGGALQARFSVNLSRKPNSHSFERDTRLSSSVAACHAEMRCDENMKTRLNFGGNPVNLHVRVRRQFPNSSMIRDCVSESKANPGHPSTEIMNPLRAESAEHPNPFHAQSVA